MTGRSGYPMRTEDLVRRAELQPGVVQLTLSRPEKLIALAEPLVAQFHDQLRALADDLTCRVVVLTGAGRVPQPLAAVHTGAARGLEG
jgi:enoyl-CoA hydratase/carnithine racemase